MPPGEYTFLEMFCDEEGCDCRRVFFYVVSSRRRDVEAVVTYGWESPAFYAHWLRDPDAEMAAEMKGPGLNLCGPQSDIAPAILELFNEVLLPDAAYMDRVKRHYQLFREAVDGARSSKTSRRRRKRRLA